MKNKLVVVVLIGLLLGAGLVLTVCDFGGNCIGTGECTITLAQGASGLYIDNSADRSSCGDTTSGTDTGCIVADYGNTWNTTIQRKVGTTKCNC